MRRLTAQMRQELGDHYTGGEVDALIRIIATELLGISNTAYFLRDEVSLGSEQQQLLDDAIARLKKQEPVQYILGETTFCDLTFNVNRAFFYTWCLNISHLTRCKRKLFILVNFST